MKGTVAFHTLGCKVNQNETEAYMGLFLSRGYEVVPFDQKADIYIINTCTVTHLGDRKSRQIIRRAVKANPEGTVVVTGCYAQRDPDEVIAIPGVDLVVGAQQRGSLVDLVEEARAKGSPIKAVSDIMAATEFEELPTLPAQQRVRAYLRIQEGCNQFCSYCIIPYVRGPLRSRGPDKVLAEAERLVGEGFPEIVLTGIHTGAYGQDWGGGTDLAWLLGRLVEIPGLRRLRFSSVEPTEVNERLLRVMADHPEVCPHLHIPLQSGQDEILARMNRRYTTDRYRRVVEEVLKFIPDAAVTTDIMVGFPGETEEHFEQGREFIASLPLADLHVFKYSPRSGTPAAAFPQQVSHGAKEERSRRLLQLAKDKAKAFATRFQGKKRPVLVEFPHERVKSWPRALNPSESLWEGYTDNYIRVVLPLQEDGRGKIIPVTLGPWMGDYAAGH